MAISGYSKEIGYVKNMIAPLAIRDFRVFWFGQFISSLGNSFQTVALALLVLQVDGTALTLSTALIALTVPNVALTLVGGIFVDRMDPRVIMVFSDLIRGIVVALITLLTYLDWIPIWLLYVLLIIQGGANGIFYPAYYSIIPQLVPRGQLESANSLSQLTPQFSTIIGGPLAGIIIAWAGTSIAFGINALSFVISAYFAFQITSIKNTSTHSSIKSPLRDAGDGFIYVWKSKWFMTLLLVELVLGFAIVGPLTVGLPLLYSHTGDFGAKNLGLLLGGFGLGSIIGIMCSAAFPARNHRGLRYLWLHIAQVPLLAGTPFVPLPFAIIFLISIGTFNSYTSILYLTLIQTQVEQAMIGRVMGFVSLAGFGLTPLSQLTVGALINAMSIQYVFVGFSIIFAGATFIGFLIPSIRKL